MNSTAHTVYEQRFAVLCDEFAKSIAEAFEKMPLEGGKPTLSAVNATLEKVTDVAAFALTFHAYTVGLIEGNLEAGKDIILTSVRAKLSALIDHGLQVISDEEAEAGALQ